jgi:DNA-binding CsgD family transcriptional regulator
VGQSRAIETDLEGRVARLTKGQRECLDLVDDHATSKEIARQLGISRHTVDARLRGAIQTLGVSSRREAALIYRTAAQAQSYQPFAYQPSRIVNPNETAAHSGHAEDATLPDEIEPRLASRPVAAAADAAVFTAAPFAAATPRPTPTLRLWGGANDLSLGQRVAGILIVMIVAMLAFGVMLSGIEALTLLRS